MLQRFFSCFNDSSDQRQIDLSRNTLPPNNQLFIAQVNPESNIMGERINFETQDFNHQNLRNFLGHNNLNKNNNVNNVNNNLLAGNNNHNGIHQQHNNAGGLLQKFYHEPLDEHDNFTGGFEETKITTASPSKNHLHKLQLEEMNPDLVPVFHQGSMMSRNRNENSQNDLFNQNNNNNNSSNNMIRDRESPQDENNSLSIIIDNPNNNLINNDNSYPQATDISLINQPQIEKQLNNYLQQANVLSQNPHHNSNNNQRNTLSSQRSPTRNIKSQKGKTQQNSSSQNKQRSSTDKEQSSGSYYAQGGGTNSQTNNYGQITNQMHSYQSSACKQHSQDSSQASSRIMFNAAQFQTSNFIDHQMTTIPDLMAPISTQNKDSKTPGQSFYKTLGGQTSARHKRTATGAAINIKKDKMLPTPQTIKQQTNMLNQQQQMLPPQTRNIKASFGLENNSISYQTVQAPRSIRASMASKSDSLKSSSQKSTPLRRGQRQSPQQQLLIDSQQMENNVIIEEQNQDLDQTVEEINHQEEDNYNGVLDYEDGYQMDLGNLQSLNKRQTSKTEVFQSNMISPQKLAKAMMIGAMPSNSHTKHPTLFQQSITSSHLNSQNLISSIKKLQKQQHSHKKNQSQIPFLQYAQNTANLYQATRNSNLQKRNTQVSPSPQTREKMLQSSINKKQSNIPQTTQNQQQLLSTSHSKRLSYGGGHNNNIINQNNHQKNPLSLDFNNNASSRQQNASPLRSSSQLKSLNQLEEDSIRLVDGHFKRLSMGSPTYFKIQNQTQESASNSNNNNNMSNSKSGGKEQGIKKIIATQLNSSQKYHSNISQQSNKTNNSNKYSSVIQQNYKNKNQML